VSGGVQPGVDRISHLFRDQRLSGARFTTLTA
jgi:hypothetical protein